MFKKPAKKAGVNALRSRRFSDDDDEEQKDGKNTVDSSSHILNTSNNGGSKGMAGKQRIGRGNAAADEDESWLVNDDDEEGEPEAEAEADAEIPRSSSSTAADLFRLKKTRTKKQLSSSTAGGAGSKRRPPQPPPPHTSSSAAPAISFVEELLGSDNTPVEEFKVKKLSAAFQSSSVLAALEINFKSRLDQQDQEHSLSKVDYSLDGLAKLKQSQLTKPKPDQDFGSVKKSGKVKKKHLSVSWAVAHGDGDDGSEGDVISRDNLNSSDPSMDVDYKIPDSAAIFEAKKLRELKRNMKDLHRRDEEQQQRNNNNNNDEDELEELEPAAARELDFISLKSDAGVEGKKRGARGGGGGNIDEDEEDYNENTNIHAPRLISEDQEMEGLEAFEDNQDQNISFGAESIKNFDKRRKKEFEDNFKTVQEAQDGSEEDEELAEWERAQMRKGGFTGGNKHDDDDQKNILGPYNPKVPNIVNIPSASSILDNLNRKLYSMKTNIQEKKSQLQYFQQETQKSKDAIQSLEKDKVAVQEKYTFYAETREFVDDFVEFMDAKIPKIDKIEAEILTMDVEKTTRIAVKRRLVSLERDFASFTDYRVPLNIHLESDKDIQQDDFDMTSFISNRQDKYSRVVSENQIADNSNWYDVMKHARQLIPLEDDFDATETSKYASARDDAVDSLSTLLDDANDDFRVFSNVLQRIFEKWSSSYPKDYEMAYGTLSVPGVAEMFVRTEMCGFHYLEAYEPLESRTWHEAIIESPIPLPPLDSSENPDPQLPHLSKVVEKFIIPRITEMLTAGCFDAFNATHSQTATRLLRDLQMYVAPTHTTWVTMLGSFEARIEEALTLILSKFQLESYQYRGQAANQNLWWDGNGPVERVFWKLCELYRSIAVWNRIIKMETIVRWMMTLASSVLVPLLMAKFRMHTRTSFPNGREDWPEIFRFVDKFEMIVSNIPKDWIESDPITYKPPAFLATSIEPQLVEFCCFVREKLQADKQGLDVEQRTWVYETLTELCVSIRSYDEASKLGKAAKKL